MFTHQASHGSKKLAKGSQGLLLWTAILPLSNLGPLKAGTDHSLSNL
jgi:hypothetical protein